MANTHNSKAKLGQKNKKNEGKKVMPLALAGIRTRDLQVMRPPLYQLSYWGREEIWAKNQGILSQYVRENEANFKHFIK